MQKESPFKGMLEDPSFKEHVLGLRTGEKSPESRLDSLNQALGIISTLYKKEDFIGALKGYHDIFWGNKPLTLDYLNKIYKADQNVTEETIIYTLCQAANDAAGICLQKIISSPKLPENRKDDVANFALRFIEKQIDMGTKLGDVSIFLKAVNNTVKIRAERTLRHFYDENISSEIKAKTKGILREQIRSTFHYVGLAEMAIRSNPMNRNPDNIEFKSAIKDAKLHPANNSQLSLKHIANSLNTIGALYIYLGNMSSYPDDPTIFFESGRKALAKADQFHMSYLDGKEIGREFEQRKLAIQSNLGYTYIAQMLRANFNSVNVNDLSGFMDKVANNFISNFLLPLGSLEKNSTLTPEEIKEIKDFFKMESITRSLEILDLIYKSNTDKSTTLNMHYLAKEKQIYTAIITHFNIQDGHMEPAEGETGLIIKKKNIKKAAIRLVGMGIFFLEESKTPADNEDRIFFKKALEGLKKMTEIETELIPAQV